MLAALSDYFYWWQVPILILGLLVFFVGNWLLLWVGGRFLAKAPKATLGRAFLTNLLGGIAGSVAMSIVNALMAGGSRAAGGNPGIAMAGGLAGCAAGVAGYVLVVMFLFKTTFGKALLAWLPTIPTALLTVALWGTL